MTIQEILKIEDKGKLVSELKKGRLTDQPDIATLKKQWEPKDHAIFNESERPNKIVHYNIVDENDPSKEKTLTRIEKVARVAVAFQKLIVKRASSFLFGNPVKVVSSDPESEVKTAVEKILKSIRQQSVNKRAARNLFATTEVAEYWYPVDTGVVHNKYGFPTTFKLRCFIFSPLNGDTLYPFFDDAGDLVAFSREFIRREDNTDVTYFETWTSEKYYQYAQKNGDWQEIKTEDLIIGKIPIVYGSQENAEWADVQWMIERVEKLLSNHGDTNDYHGSPKILVKGEVKGFAKKGEAGGILELEGDEADAKYLSYENAPESVKLEFENLFRLIHSITQTPDISFEAVKGMGNSASGSTLQMLFLDAHLKVMDKMEVFEEYLERRFNILKSYVGLFNKSLKAEAEEVELTPEVIPYMVDDLADKIDNLTTAVTGGILSKKTAVTKNPLVDDAAAEIEELANEQEAANASAQALNDLQNQNV